MRESSNPVFRSLPKTQGGYAQFGTGAAGYGAQQVQAEPYVTQYPDQQQAGVSRPLTIDDVVTKTGITLAVLTTVAAVTYFLVGQNPALAMPLWLVGMIGGLAMVLIATFGRKQDKPGIVLTYAVFEGLFLGAFSFVVANFIVNGDISAGALISQAIVGTLGVFVGMLVVYKTGAIRVTPKFTRFLVGALFGVVALGLVNFLLAHLRRRRRFRPAAQRWPVRVSSSRSFASALPHSASCSTSTRQIRQSAQAHRRRPLGALRSA